MRGGKKRCVCETTAVLPVTSHLVATLTIIVQLHLHCSDLWLASNGTLHLPHQLQDIAGSNVLPACQRIGGDLQPSSRSLIFGVHLQHWRKFSRVVKGCSYAIRCSCIPGQDCRPATNVLMYIISTVKLIWPTGKA